MLSVNTAYYILLAILSFIVLKKTVQISQHGWWILLKGSACRKELLLALKNMPGNTINLDVLSATEKKFHPPFPLFTPLISPLAKRWKLFRFYKNFIDRQPMLVVLQSILIFFSPQPSLAITISFILLLLLIIVSLIHLLLGRCILGYIDNFRQDFHFLHKPYTTASKIDFVRKFTFGIIVIVTTSIIGFAAIYYGIYQASPSVSFNNLQSTNVPLQLIYFSVITAATIGYGDITPCYGWPQFLVSLQVIYFMGVLITLIFSLSNTFEPEKD
jgi:hypothetical protein